MARSHARTASFASVIDSQQSLRARRGSGSIGGSKRRGLRAYKDTNNCRTGTVRAYRASDDKRRMSYMVRARGGSYVNGRGSAGALR